MNKVTADYERSKALYNENIGSEKDFLNIENEYKTTRANYQSLKLRLEILNLNTSKIEAGEFVSSFPVLTPISGSVTSMEAVLGEFSMQQNMLIEIVNVKQLIVKLSVFEKDIDKVKIGQTVKFSSANENSAVHTATIFAIGKSIDEMSKTITCLASINYKEEVNWINNTFVEAKIIIDKADAEALPNTAFLKSGQDYYVFTLSKTEGDVYFLKQKKVEPGRVSDGYTEILNGVGNQNIVTQGVYNLRIE